MTFLFLAKFDGDDVSFNRSNYCLKREEKQSYYGLDANLLRHGLGFVNMNVIAVHQYMSQKATIPQISISTSPPHWAH